MNQEKYKKVMQLSNTCIVVRKEEDQSNFKDCKSVEQWGRDLCGNTNYYINLWNPDNTLKCYIMMPDKTKDSPSTIMYFLDFLDHTCGIEIGDKISVSDSPLSSFPEDSAD